MKPESQPGFWHSRGKSIACAVRGIALLLKTQPNARIHLLATVLVTAAGFFFHLKAREWTAITFAIGLVWVAEGVNTAIEILADRVTRDRDEQIGMAKDIAAGAVMLASITSVFTGIFILGPHAWALLRGHAG